LYPLSKASSKAFYKFYAELCNIEEEEGGFLTFSDNSKHIANIKSVYIRESYRTLYDRLIDIILPRDQWSMNQKIHLTGTPGIGKTTFIIYMMWKLIRHRLQPAFIYSSLKSHGFFYCKGREVRFCSSAPEDDRVIRLVDGNDEFALTYSAEPVILLTSPRSTNFNEFKKLEHEKFYLNIWSFEEIIKCAEKNQIDVERVKLFYHHFGGVPRSVFKELDPEKHLKSLAFFV
jgi:hypothetical protein